MPGAVWRVMARGWRRNVPGVVTLAKEAMDKPDSPDRKDLGPYSESEEVPIDLGPHLIDLDPHLRERFQQTLAAMERAQQAADSDFRERLQQTLAAMERAQQGAALELQRRAEALEGITQAAAVELQRRAKAVADYDVSTASELLDRWHLVEEAIRADEAAVDSALKVAIPFDPKDRKERWDFLLRFSTSPRGLGFTEEEFLGAVGWRDWLTRFAQWRPSRAVRPRGRPKKKKTDEIREFHKAAGGGKVSPMMLLDIARRAYPEQWPAEAGNSDRAAKAANSVRRRLMERVRATLKRTDKPAT